MAVKNKIRRYFDLLPFLILVVSASLLLLAVYRSEIMLAPRHYTGLVSLVINAFMFYYRHLFGVLFTGLIILLGLIGLLSFSPAITTSSFGWGSAEEGITLLKFQPVFLLWMLIYGIICGRHFLGIASKQYWIEVKNKQR